MAGLRKATAYSRKKVTPYTRKSKKKSKSYIKAVPPVNIVKFAMGNEQAYNTGKFPYKLNLVSIEDVQIRDSAFESCRQLINKQMDKHFNAQYFFRIVPYPHHIQRENKMLTGAGSDRMQTGMQLSFGKTVDRAAIVKKGKVIFMIATGNKKADQLARKLFHVVKSKLPCKTKIISDNVNE
jgi:large subunit ribosomal protein L10e